MKVKVITSSDKFLEDHNYRSFFAIEVDGYKEVNFLDGEPEDATINRDFSDVMSIPKLMQIAYNAGKNGEDFIIERCKIDDFDN